MFESFVSDLACYNDTVVARCMELWCVCTGRVKLLRRGVFFSGFYRRVLLQLCAAVALFIAM